jgi:cyclopropane-fatty-acyl-phospholipid synthase
LRLGAVGRPPQPPPEEVRLSGRRHSKGRDAAAIAHHYDVSNEFYELVLGESMVYSCAYWAREQSPSYGLAEAQRDKLELVSRKLGLRPGVRLLDVGCGWGALVIHAAREHGVRAVGITLSRAQAEWARKRVAEEGLDELVEIREQDWRDVDDGPFDAIASIGMAEHVGAASYPAYARSLYTLLAPRGRLLNHQIVEPARPPRSGRSFIDAYVFPDGELLPIGDVVSLIEGGGFEVRDVENLREHYARTLRCWVDNLTKHRDAALRAASAGRVRVWQLYMTGSALSFDSGQIGVAQVLAVRQARDGDSRMPATRADFLLAR